VKNHSLWIWFDVETSGPTIGYHSMIGLKASAGSVDRGVFDRFEVMLRPLSNAVVTKSEAFERADRNGVRIGDGIDQFRNWAARPLQKGAVFVSNHAERDWPWIVFYAKKFLERVPPEFHAVSASAWDRSAENLPSFLKSLARFGWRQSPVRLSSQCAAFPAWSPDGRNLVSCDGSGEWVDEQHYSAGGIHVWNARGERKYSESGSAPVSRVAWSPDGERIVALYDDGDLRTIDSDKEAGSPEWKAEARALSFRPDGRCLATCGKDRAVRLWNFPEQSLRRAIEGLADDPADLAFSPEGLRLAVGTAGGLLVWHLLPDFVAEEGHPPIESHGLDLVWNRAYRVLVFEPDGRQSERDFDSQEQANAFADDVSLGKEPLRKIALVLDSKFQVIHKGGPYRLVRVPDPKVAVTKKIAPIKKGRFRVLLTRFGVQEPHKDFASLQEAQDYAERIARERPIGNKESCVILDCRYRVVCAVPNRKERRW